MPKTSTKAKPNRTRPIALGAGVLVLLFLGWFYFQGQPAVAQSIAPGEYQTQFAASGAPHMLIDVRTPEEFTEGHIHDAVNIPLSDLNARLAEVPTDRAIVLYCRTGNRSVQAAELLIGAGYKQVYDMGGLIDWMGAGLPIE